MDIRDYYAVDDAFFVMADFTAEPMWLVVKSWEDIDFKRNGSPGNPDVVLSFEETGRRLVLSGDRARPFSAAYGYEVDDWVGALVGLSKTPILTKDGTPKLDDNGKPRYRLVIECKPRPSAPQAAVAVARPRASARADLDDDIDF